MDTTPDPASLPANGANHPTFARDPWTTSLTRLEMALLRVWEAFGLWATELHGSISAIPLSFQDLAILHVVRIRGGVRNLTEVLRFLNRTDVSNLQYSLKKLENAGLVNRTRGATKREAGYDLTPKGIALTDHYGELRHAMLVRLTRDVVDFDRQMDQAADVLEKLVGMYDQSTQAVMNRHITGTVTRP
jgi:predicted MarR family transcription regulator